MSGERNGGAVIFRHVFSRAARLPTGATLADIALTLVFGFV